VGTPTFVRLSDGTAAQIGSKVSASSIPVVVASDQAVIPVSDNAGSLTVDAPVATPVFARLSDGAAALVGSKVSASSLPVVIASDQAAVPVTAPTITKGTQGANGFTTQDLKDAGRVACVFRNTFTTALAAETVQNLIATRAGVAAGAAGSQAVTAGKRLRITSVTVSVRTTTAALPWVELRLRENPAGAAIITSPIIVHADCAGSAAVIGNAASAVVTIPDGLELSGTEQFILTIANNVATNVIDVAIYGFEY
jgi:hypothetical protein